MNSILNNLFFLLGMFAGMNIFYVDLKVIDMTLFTFILMIIILLKLCIRPRLTLPCKKIDLLFLYYIIFYISSLMSVLWVPKDWYVANLITLFSTTIGVFGFYITFNEEEKKEGFSSFVKGLKIDCCIQLGWAFLQFILFEFFSIPLNYSLGLRNAKSIMEVGYQVTGLGWERAEFCFIMALGYVLFDKMWMKLLFACGILITQSRTGMILIVLIIVMSVPYKKILQGVANLKIKLITLLGTIAFMGIIIVMKGRLINQLVTIINRFANIRNEGSGVTHMFYYKSMPRILSEIGITQILFGYGSASSGYVYSRYSNVFDLSNGPWTVESTWLSVFWSTGIIGFACWFGWFIINIYKSYKGNKKAFAFLSSVIIGGIFYTLLPNWGMLAIFAFLYFKTSTEKNTSIYTEKR